MSKEQVDSVVLSVEAVLAEAVRLQTRCQAQSGQLAVVSAQLRQETLSLREHSQAVQADMSAMRRNLEELLDTKAAFEAKERQCRKLSRQL